MGTSKVVDWSRLSFWHHDAGPRAPLPPLSGDLRADVVLIGGGYTGLWTAHFLKEAAPELDLVVVEQEGIGFGGSGRNGGFALAVPGTTLSFLTRHYGKSDGKALYQQVSRSVIDIGEFARGQRIDCDYERNGYLSVATSAREVERVEKEVEVAHALGLSGWIYLDRAAAQAKLHADAVRCGSLQEIGAILHPVKLIRGLAESLQARGVRIFENSPVLELEGAPVRVRTPLGTLAAEQAVLAVNPWSSRFEAIGPRTIPVYSYVLVTAPLSAAQRARVGWQGREAVENKKHYHAYARLTPDDRILWGGEGKYFFGASISQRHDRDPKGLAAVEADFRRTLPQLSDVAIEHRWGGAIAVTKAFMPSFGTVPSTGIHFGFGYSGKGGAPAHTGGQILRDLVLGRDSDLVRLPWIVGAKKYPTDAERYPKEPFTFLEQWKQRRRFLREDAA